MRNTVIVCEVIAINITIANLFAIIANRFDILGLGWIAGCLIVVTSAVAVCAMGRKMGWIWYIQRVGCLFTISVLLSIAIFEALIRQLIAEMESMEFATVDCQSNSCTRALCGEISAEGRGEAKGDMVE